MSEEIIRRLRGLHHPLQESTEYPQEEDSRYLVDDDDEEKEEEEVATIEETTELTPCECGSTNLIEEEGDTVCDDCGRKVSSSIMRENNDIKDNKSLALKKSLEWWRAGHYQKAVELYKKYGVTDAEFARALVQSFKESEEIVNESSRELVDPKDRSIIRKGDRVSWSRKGMTDTIKVGDRFRVGLWQGKCIKLDDKYATMLVDYITVFENTIEDEEKKSLANIIRAVQTPVSTANKPNIADAVTESEEEEDNSSLLEGDTYLKFNIPGSRVNYSYREIKDKYYVQSSHPYDEADYHWAYSLDGDTWKIYIHSPGKLVKTIRTDGDFHKVAAVLSELDKNIKPRMSHN